LDKADLRTQRLRVFFGFAANPAVEKLYRLIRVC
jgi:hypothetical protein